MTLSKNINFPPSFLLILTFNFPSISHCKKTYSESDILEAQIDHFGDEFLEKLWKGKYFYRNQEEDTLVN